jgi:hypothetical protein
MPSSKALPKDSSLDDAIGAFKKVFASTPERSA